MAVFLTLSALFSPSSNLPLPCLQPRRLTSQSQTFLNPNPKTRVTNSHVKKFGLIVRCESPSPAENSGLRIGSPVIIVEAPLTLKTADSMPSLKMNSGLIKPGDVGRIIARKPKDVWVVRLTIGTFLMDAKYFKPLDIDE